MIPEGVGSGGGLKGHLCCCPLHPASVGIFGGSRAGCGGGSVFKCTGCPAIADALCCSTRTHGMPSCYRVSSRGGDVPS